MAQVTSFRTTKNLKEGKQGHTFSITLLFTKLRRTSHSNVLSITRSPSFIVFEGYLEKGKLGMLGRALPLDIFGITFELRGID